jgi:ABC-type lipoprotein export system ATPase subunit
VADDPAAKLDRATAAEVAAILRRVSGEGTEGVVPTHDPRLIEPATTVLSVEGGRVETVRAPS